MPVILEAELEEFLFDRFDVDGAVEIGDLNLYGEVHRQVNIAGCGVIDLMLVDCTGPGLTYGIVYVIELKKGEITLEDIAQVSRYTTAVRKAVNGIKNILVRSILIGDGTVGGVGHIINEMQDLSFYQYVLDLEDGINFIDLSCGWENDGVDIEKTNKIIKDCAKREMLDWIKLSRGL